MICALTRQKRTLEIVSLPKMRMLIARLSAFKRQFHDVVGVGMLHFLAKYAGATSASSIVRQEYEDMQLGRGAPSHE